MGIICEVLLHTIDMIFMSIEWGP